MSILCSNYKLQFQVGLQIGFICIYALNCSHILYLNNKIMAKKNREPYEQFPHDVTINRFIPFDIVIIV